ncbi:XRE family transcriptional regulator (plasmid) [Arsenophonus sp. aPb]|uniref:helix-turn-helix domain-containing protein n=1 Tax=Arsenophonus sp. aPb TaxID=3041619 RepID=UPI0024686857|nr:XRE family transcriptional regulator [Arsenophonus sp. aPb]WGL99770.1 XRE family transcriptional regulator [Arsenophonus sp. aPb]
MTDIALTAETVKRLRVKTGLTQKEIAKLFGISLNYWQRKELNPDSAQHRKISKSEYTLLLLLAGEHPDFILQKRGHLEK